MDRPELNQVPVILVLQFTPRVNYLVVQYVDWILQNHHVKTSSSVKNYMKWFERFEFVEEFFWFDRWNEISLLVLRLSCVVYSVFRLLKSWFWARVDTKYLASWSYWKAGQTGFLVLTQRQQICDIRRLHHKFIGKQNRFKGRKTTLMLQTLARSNLCSLVFYKKI